MKITDKFLLGLVLGVALLVGAAFALVLTRPAPAYQPDDTPEGALHNYLFALQTKDYQRAYRYLSPELSGYPATWNSFRQEVRNNTSQFSFDAMELRILPEETQRIGDQAEVTLQIRQLGSGGPFAGDSITQQVFTLHQTTTTWQLLTSKGYYFWNHLWEWEEE